MPLSFLISSPLGNIHFPHIENILGRAVGAKSYSHHRSSRQRSISRRGMPSERVINTENGAMRAFKMNESTFMSSLMPKQEIGAVKFLDDHPTYDGRGVVVAIFDSGVDPAAAGLQITSDGKPKVIDIIDCTGSGDIDTSKVVKADVDGFIIGASGARLMVNSEWKNPSGEWHVGYKFVYGLFTDSLTARLKKERRKKWKEEHAKALLPASKDLSSFDQKHPSSQSKALKKEREDLQNRVDFLRKHDERYEDKGPVIDVVVWNDGNLWRAAVDTKDLEEDSEKGKLENFVPLTNYRLERKYGVFSRLDACTFSVNIYDEGNILSIVTDCSPHGTHVAGITAAHHPEEPLLNGIAPGAQIVSCKIGDTRLGSMETGTGLTRALIAVVENKCDLINMSYGEPTMMPDYGRFIKLLNEVVNKYKVIFVSSAGNEGPALSTVTAPGGTSSSIIGIGAYVSPNMAAAAHCLVEPPSEGLEYTWSSRGPTVDGDLGVCLSAPGGAVAPVPTWTLQRRMLMNGTSMASPCACGGVALLLSSMKAEGLSISPYVVRKALENTAVPINDELVEKLSTGQGLIQVDQAYDYLQKCKDIPAVRYQVEITQNGSSGPSMRGIYLREPSDSLQTSEWNIQIKPKFHDDADNLTELVPFEECIQLKSSSCEIVRVPEYLLLTYNGRTFNILVDPTSLPQGVHYFEVEGIDYNAPCRGSLFRIPITVIKPYTVQETIISFPGISFLAGHIERRFINVPFGASWVEATIRASGFDTPRRFFINSLQICPKSRPSVWESVVTFSSPALKRFSFSVEGGRTMEITIAQFWSSGNGSHAEAVIDLEVEFHGLLVDKKEIALPCTEAYTKIDVKALLSSENLCPLGQLSSIKVPYRPFESVVAPLPTEIDRLPSQAQIYGLTLTYKFTLNESYSVTPCIPLLNNRVYDTEFESQFYMIADINKRIVGMGDVYPKSVRLSKGDYFVRLLLRHDNTQFLEKLKNLILFIKMDLEEKNIVKLNFYSEPDGAVTGENSFKPMVLLPGQSQAFYIASPSDDKLPKNISAGSNLVGNITVGKLSLSGAKKTEKDESCPPSYLISYMVPPAKVDEKDKEKDKGKGGAAVKKSVKKYWEDELRDSKVKVLMNLPRDSVEDFEEWKQFAAALKSEYPNYTPLLARILDGIVSWNSKTDNVKHNIEIIKAAEEVIASIDKDELAKYFGMKCETEDEEAVETKKKMEAVRTHLSDALYNKGLALAELENLKTQTEEEDSLTQDTVGGISQPDDEAKKKEDAFEENYLELCKWADAICSKYGLLAVQRERRCKRLGSALKVVEDLICDDSKPPEKKLFELKLSLIKEVGWTHLASYEKDWLLIRFPPNYPLF